MSYIAIRSFTSQRSGRYVPRGKRISWFSYSFYTKGDKLNFVDEDFYDDPEREYIREKTAYPQRNVGISSEDDMRLRNDPNFTFSHDPWSHHPHETFEDGGISIPIMDTMSTPDLTSLMEEHIDEVGTLLDDTSIIQMYPPDPDTVPSREVDYPSMSPDIDTPMFPSESDSVIRNDDGPSYSGSSSSDSNNYSSSSDNSSSSYDSGSSDNSWDSSSSNSDSSSSSSSSD